MTYPNPLPAPPVLRQTEMHCWSAAFESWDRACGALMGYTDTTDQTEIERYLRRFPDTLDSRGGATAGGMGLMANRGRMNLAGRAPGDLTAADLRHLLMVRGYIYLVYYWPAPEGGLSSHAVVIYGVEGNRLLLMDPVEGRGLIARDCSYYTARYVAFLVGTHRPSG